MTVLVLAGTAEARELCAEMSVHKIDVIASLAGVTSLPAKYPVPTRIGGFGGVEGLRSWLRSHDVTALIDATHPFAAQMPWHAAAAAEQIGTPRLRLMRPEWPAQTGWQIVHDIAAAAEMLPPAAHVFLSTGRGDIGAFKKRSDVTYTLRSIEPPEQLPAHMTSLIARPPFSVEGEVETFTRLGITHLVSKNAGGPGRAKLDAAARLDLPVVMVARPNQPPGEMVSTVADAVAWAAQTVEN